MLGANRGNDQVWASGQVNSDHMGGRRSCTCRSASATLHGSVWPMDAPPNTSSPPKSLARLLSLPRLTTRATTGRAMPRGCEYPPGGPMPSPALPLAALPPLLLLLAALAALPPMPLTTLLPLGLALGLGAAKSML